MEATNILVEECCWAIAEWTIGRGYKLSNFLYEVYYVVTAGKVRRSLDSDFLVRTRLGSFGSKSHILIHL